MRWRTVLQPAADDWPGVFIRGDDALSYAHKLRVLLKTAVPAETRAELARLARLLESCRVESRDS
jgi:hypothetical protein